MNLVTATTHTLNDLTVLKSQDKRIKSLKKQEEQPNLHGNKVWKSAHLLVDFFNIDPPTAHASVIELGCGWGIVGQYCAKIFQSKWIAVDADPNVFPYLHLHCEINAVKPELELVKTFDQLDQADLEGVELLFGSDICFWDELQKSLFKLVKRANRSGVKRVVIADPGRSPFFELAKACHKRYHCAFYEWNTPAPNKASGFILEITF